MNISFPITDGYKERGLRNKLVALLSKKGISDVRVLEAIRRVPRHVFFDNALLGHAYEDKAFPIGEGQTISQPYTVAFQTQALQIEKGHRVLEIGTGSGYQAAILLELGARLYTIEYNRKLYLRVKNDLPQLGYKPFFICGDGTLGLPGKAPFDRILVTAGAPAVPEALTGQLANKGKLVIPVGDRNTQQMLCITRQGDTFVTEKFDNFAFVPLLGKQGWNTSIN